jgi:hypothetical protein
LDPNYKVDLKLLNLVKEHASMPKKKKKDAGGDEDDAAGTVSSRLQV